MSIEWDTVSPLEVTTEALRLANDEDFPETYSGQSWRAAHRILKHFGDDVEAIRNLDPWKLDGKACGLYGLDLTGFMVGWACGVLRQMHGATPGKSGAVVEIGGGVVEQEELIGNAASELGVALNGTPIEGDADVL